ncbi:hypothetical protein NQ318_019193 [Aromia moschata]|uniref:C2H2-type domain-containing protein n=1 Tax=Aromia moschata TaxID=1265417 RepID=A0AAV8YSX0_9CUCU|nr:hypothetical protein NQ318_019193 [Aromia moschata]
MGSLSALSLSCPLCCDEKFSSHSSLKYHILSIIDNLLCPACGARYDCMLELAEHLGRECKEKELKELPVPPSLSENIKQEAQSQTQEFPLLQNAAHELSNNSETVLLNPKIEAEDDANDSNNSILAKALMAKPPSNNTELVEAEEQLPVGALYMCQMCDMSFNSIEEHLEKYHAGEELILETDENLVDESNADVIEEDEGGTDIDENMFALKDDSENGDDLETDEKTQTIEEQQCLDKEGRIYTRKVVKIDKFWIDDLNSPMTEKYVLENGKIRKISEDEAENILDKDAIIQIHQCPKCYLQFPNLDHYNKHFCDPSKVKNKFKCIHCTAVFLNYQSLTSHMKSHVSKDPSGKFKRVVTLGPYTCDICKTMFPSFKSLRLHKRMHDPIKDKAPEAPVTYSITGPIDEAREIVRHMFICSICNKTYDKEYEDVHMRSHSQEENYDCPVCNRKFYTKENLEMHVKAHSNGKKFSCSYCKKPFTTYDALQDHVTNQCQKRQYECQYCGRRFSRPHEKVKHERIHTGEKPHVCQICGKAFRVSYCLTLHLRTHSGTRPYQCTTCGKRFKSHSVYNHHLLTHSDVRAYKCPYCPKAFKTSVQLAGHKNSHIKPFACTECNRPFASLYAVRAHMETHKRENNLKFDCWMCGATYARAFALRDHIKSHHAGGENMGMDDNVLIELETNESTSQIENEMNASIGQEMEVGEEV